MNFFPCSLMRPSSSRSAIVTYFFKTAGGILRVSRRSAKARYAPFSGGAERHCISSISSKLVHPHPRSSAMSSISWKANCRSFAGISIQSSLGTGSVILNRVKLQLALRMPMSVSLNEGNERMYFYAKDVYCGKCINSA